MSYIIVKHVKIDSKKFLPVILIDSLGEVLNFDTRDNAEYFLALFQANSDSSHRYEIRSINRKECNCNTGCKCK